MSGAPVTKTPSDVALKKRGSELKHVTTKEYSGEPTEDEIAAIKKIYDEMSASPKDLAAHFQIDETLLRDNPPESVAEFAKALFQGFYTQDKDAAAKEEFRQHLRVELRRTSSKLKQSTTKDAAGPSAEDIAAAAKLYEEVHGDFSKLAEKLNIDKALLTKDPPTSAGVFGQKLFAGNYTPDADETAKDKLRERLRPAILQKRPSLKKTATKEGADLGQDDSELQLAMKLFPGTNAKEIDAVAQKLGLSAEHMKANPGEDEADFAKKVLAGAYTPDLAEMAKQDLRLKLQAAVKERRPSLRHVAPPRRMSNVSDEEITNFGAFYTKKGGNLEAIAAESGLPLEALQANPPANSAEFVLKLLDGSYTVDMTAQAKATLRCCMRQEVMRTKTHLKTATSKEWDGEANAEDVKLVAQAYEQRKGNLQALVAAFGLSGAILEAHPPKDAQDFAKNVLLGRYSVA